MTRSSLMIFTLKLKKTPRYGFTEWYKAWYRIKLWTWSLFQKPLRGRIRSQVLYFYSRNDISLRIIYGSKNPERLSQRISGWQRTRRRPRMLCFLRCFCQFPFPYSLTITTSTNNNQPPHPLPVSGDTRINISVLDLENEFMVGGEG